MVFVVTTLDKFNMRPNLQSSGKHANPHLRPVIDNPRNIKFVLNRKRFLLRRFYINLRFSHRKNHKFEKAIYTSAIKNPSINNFNVKHDAIEHV